MKKFFLSLMLGFGAALGVFVALAMPPGGWGVAVGVGLGLLGCLPLLLIMMMLIGRGHTDRSKQVYEEAPQPVIIVQHSGGYDPFGGYGQPLPQYYPRPQYPPDSDYYAYAEPDQRRRSGPPQDYYRLPSSRRRSQPITQYPEYSPEEYYTGDYYEPEPEYYDAPPPQPAQYDAYYGSREAAYYHEQPERPRRRPARTPSRLDAVEADYRTIGEAD
jgi:hypothetical protein